jgi:hypothetical protein
MHHRPDRGGKHRPDARDGRQAAGVRVGLDRGHHLPVEPVNPCGQGLDLRHQFLQRHAGTIGKAAVLSIGNDREPLAEACPALGRDNTQFGHGAAQRVGGLDTLANQHLAGLEPHPGGLLLNRLDRPEAQARPDTAAPIAAASAASVLWRLPQRLT